MNVRRGVMADINDRSIHVVSEAHALVVVPLALCCLRLPSLEVDRVFGWDDLAGTVQAIACGCVLIFLAWCL
jgi:hypothetical protein